MSGFSIVDGFVEITESVAEMIKFVANEPSVGLFYIQQHTENAVPNVVNLHDQVVEKSHEAALHTEDLEDSISMARSMKDFGFLIVNDMIMDIKSSLALMSTKQLRRGLIHSPASSFRIGRTSSWGPGFGNVQLDGSNYFSTVIKSARQKVNNLKWPQLDSKEQMEAEPRPQPAPLLSVASASTSSIPDIEVDEPPVSSQRDDEFNEEDEKEESNDDFEVSHHTLPFVSENYDEWLEGTEVKK